MQFVSLLERPIYLDVYLHTATIIGAIDVILLKNALKLNVIVSDLVYSSKIASLLLLRDMHKALLLFYIFN
jgi:hypothetical protein